MNSNIIFELIGNIFVKKSKLIYEIFIKYDRYFFNDIQYLDASTM